MSSDHDIANAWIRIYEAEEESPERDDNFWAYNELAKFCDFEPERCFAVINLIRKCNPSDAVLANLASGPLEDLLTKHGDKFIDRIEQVAKKDAQLRKLLGAVWQNEIPDPIWNRIQTIAAPSW